MRTQLGLFTVLIGAYALAATPACSSGSGPTSPVLSGWYETTDPTSAITAIGFVDSSHYVMWKTCQAAYETCGFSGTYDFEDNDTTMSMTDDVSGETTRMKFMTLSPPSAASELRPEHLEDEPTSGALTPGSSQSLTPGGSSPWGIGVDSVPFLGPSALTTDSQTDPRRRLPYGGCRCIQSAAPPQELQAPFVCPPSTVLPANAVEGIDISHYQLCPFSNGHCSGGNAHFDQVAQVAKFVIFKATEGNSQLDPTFQTDFKAAKDQTGGTLIRGAYHFLRAKSPAPQSKVLTGAEQAQWFYNNVTMAGGLDATEPSSRSWMPRLWPCSTPAFSQRTSSPSSRTSSPRRKACSSDESWSTRALFFGVGRAPPPSFRSQRPSAADRRIQHGHPRDRFPVASRSSFLGRRLLVEQELSAHAGAGHVESHSLGQLVLLAAPPERPPLEVQFAEPDRWTGRGTHRGRRPLLR